MSLWQSVIITASEVYEPRNGYGLVGLLIIGLPALITAAGTVWVLIRQRGVRERVEQVAQGVEKTNKQVVNGHTQPMRNDLDEKFDALGQTVDKVHETLIRHLEEHIHLKG